MAGVPKVANIFLVPEPQQFKGQHYALKLMHCVPKIFNFLRIAFSRGKGPPLGMQAAEFCTVAVENDFGPQPSARKLRQKFHPLDAGSYPVSVHITLVFNPNHGSLAAHPASLAMGELGWKYKDYLQLATLLELGVGVKKHPGHA
jgi:hypothetical protein